MFWKSVFQKVEIISGNVYLYLFWEDFQREVSWLFDWHDRTLKECFLITLSVLLLTKIIKHITKPRNDLKNAYVIRKTALKISSFSLSSDPCIRIKPNISPNPRINISLMAILLELTFFCVPLPRITLEAWRLFANRKHDYW